MLKYFKKEKEEDVGFKMRGKQLKILNNIK